MGSDLQLTGLASGFDWKPVVEQLIELEAIPKARLQREKTANESKISDLGLLKSQLDTLNGASKTLQNEDLFDARKVTMDSASALVLSATAAAGTLTGTYKVEVVSLATSTQMTSENRIVNGLGNPINLSTSLSDLPLQSKITAGTFTIGGRTFNITDLSMTMQQLIDEVNNNGSGFDPEKDGTYITLEYDATNDRMIIDGGDISTGGAPNIPILGSPTDSSNFLQVMRLLNRTPDAPRLADYETWSGISLFGSTATNNLAWIKPNDFTESPAATDDRIFTAYDPNDIPGQSNKLLYRRKEASPDIMFNDTRNKVSETALTTAWDSNSIAYNDGFLFKLKSSVAGSFASSFNTVYNPDPTNSTPPPTAQGGKVKVTTRDVTHDEKRGFWELAVDLSAISQDSDAIFGTAVASHSATSAGTSYNQGDIVKAHDGNGYFRAVKDRDYATAVQLGVANIATVAGTAGSPSTGWSEPVSGQFSPDVIEIGGRLYKIVAGSDLATKGIKTHLGNGTDTNIYTDGDFLTDKAGEGDQKKVFRAKAGWTKITTHSATAVNNTTNSRFWEDGVNGAGKDSENNFQIVKGSDNKFYMATSDWANIQGHNGGGSDDASLKLNYTSGDYVFKQNSAGPPKTGLYYEAAAAWDSVNALTGAADVTNFTKDEIAWRNQASGNKYLYQAKGDFGNTNLSTPVSNGSRDYEIFNAANVGTAATLQKMVVRVGTGSGTKYYKFLGDIAHSGGGRVDGTNHSSGQNITSNKVVQRQADKLYYKAQIDLSSIGNHLSTTNYDTFANDGVNSVVHDNSNAGNYYENKKKVAHQTFSGTGPSFTKTKNIINTPANNRIINTGDGKVYEAKTALTTAILAHSNSAVYTNNQIVSGASSFYKAIVNMTDVDSAGPLTKVHIAGFSTGDLVRNTDSVEVFKLKQAIAAHAAGSDYDPGGTIAKKIVKVSNDFFKPNFEIKAWDQTRTNYTASNHVIRDGSSFYQIAGGKTYKGVHDGSSTTTVNGDWVTFDNGSGAQLWERTGTSGAATASPTNTPGDWTARGTGFANALFSPVTGMASDPTAAGNTIWADANANIIDTTDTTYWDNETTNHKTLTNGSYWTDLSTISAEDPKLVANTTYWKELTDAADARGDGYVANDDPTVLSASSNYWIDKTNEITLTTAPGSGAANSYWGEVTGNVMDFSGTPTENTTHWSEVTNELTLGSSEPGLTASNDFWTNFSGATIDGGGATKGAGDLTNTSYWTPKTTFITDLAASNTANKFWSEVTNNVTDLSDTVLQNTDGSSRLWREATEVTDTSDNTGVAGLKFADNWTEFAHANSWTNYDYEYWQKVEPGMTRLIGSNGINPAFTTPNLTEAIMREHNDPDPSGYEWDDYVRQQDMTLWKQVANIHGYRGGAASNADGQTDGSVRFGDHDSEEKIGRPSGPIQAWNNTNFYESGDIVKNAGGTKYYRMRGNGAAIDPEDVDWAAAGTGSVTSSNLKLLPDPSTADANPFSPNSTDTSYQKWPGAAYWDLIWDTSVNGTTGGDANVYKLSYTDTDYWEQYDIPAPTSTSMADNVNDDWWELIQETTISSSQALGTVDLSKKIRDANFSGFDIKNFTHDGTMPISEGGTGLIQNGAFFVGEGAGAVRISYDVENDSISDLMDRVSKSDAGVTMFYDPVGDRFVLRNDKAGALGLTLHESPSDAGTFNPNPPFEWDTVTGNRGKGNVLQLMGFVDKTFQGDTNFGQTIDAAYPYYRNSATYAKGDTVRLRIGNLQQWSYWRANEAISAGEGEPSVDKPKWVQVIPGVGRAIMDELGTNATIKLNDSNNLIYSNESIFGKDSHGYEGLNINVTKGSVGDVGTFVVSKDSTQVVSAVEKFVEEFNDAQDYIQSLTSVTNDGENVSAGKFSSNIEISRLGSQLRKVVFGDSTVHSQSELANDGASLTIGSDTDVTSSSSWTALATELELKTDGTGDGYIIKIENDTTAGNTTTYKIWEDDGTGTWGWTDNYKPTFSSFRLSDIGLDFGVGSDRLIVRNSAALLDALENNTDKVKALFAESIVESTKTATASDLYADWAGTTTAYSYGDIVLDTTNSTYYQKTSAGILAASGGNVKPSSTPAHWTTISITPPKTLNNSNPNSPTGTNAVVGDKIANSAAYDLNSGSYRAYQGISDAVDEFISAFLSGDSDSGYKGAYNTHIESVRSQNKRIDDKIEDMERYLEQREKTLSDGFMRMEEMQSQLNTQLQTLQNSFSKK